jgi:predicted N-acetyltransferase YhbS
MSIQYAKADAGDYAEIIDLANYVFSAASRPTDFPSLLPKLYAPERFMDGIHYIAREEGRIKALVGAYPLELRVLAEALPGRGIGMVSVHPRARSQGCMRALMAEALRDMQRDGIAFSCLGGQRQRYEYFGYTPLGSYLAFECNSANLRHAAAAAGSGLSLKRLAKDDDAGLDTVFRLHEAKLCAAARPRDRLFALLSSWRAEAYLFTGTAHGYAVRQGNEITEINLDEPDHCLEAVKLLMETLGEERVIVRARPEERRKIAALSRFAESWNLRTAYSFAFFDLYRMLEPFVRLACTIRRIPDGSAGIHISGCTPMTLAVSDGTPSFSPGAAQIDLSLPSIQAASRFFFSWLTPLIDERASASPLLHSLLPLPLSWEPADEV